MIRELCIDDDGIYYDLGVYLNTKFKRLFELSKILNSQKDKIKNLLNDLINKKLAKKLILVKYDNQIIGKKRRKERR